MKMTQDTIYDVRLVLIICMEKKLIFLMFLKYVLIYVKKIIITV